MFTLTKRVDMTNKPGDNVIVFTNGIVIKFEPKTEDTFGVRYVDSTISKYSFKRLEDIAFDNCSGEDFITILKTIARY